MEREKVAVLSLLEVAEATLEYARSVSIQSVVFYFIAFQGLRMNCARDLDAFGSRP